MSLLRSIAVKSFNLPLGQIDTICVLVNQRNNQQSVHYWLSRCAVSLCMPNVRHHLE